MHDDLSDLSDLSDLQRAALARADQDFLVDPDCFPSSRDFNRLANAAAHEANLRWVRRCTPGWVYRDDDWWRDYDAALQRRLVEVGWTVRYAVTITVHPADDLDGDEVTYPVTIVVPYSRELQGEITLYRDPRTGRLSPCGAPIDGWASPALVAWMRGLTDCSHREVARVLAGGVGETLLHVEEQMR